MRGLAFAPSVPRGNNAELAVLSDLPVELIDIGTNVRVDPSDLEGLAASIKAEGLAQPVQVVGPHADGRYRLVYGQRRLLASRLAELPTIRAIVLAESDVDEPGPKRAILQLAENLQRLDLNPIEEATALREVLDGNPTLTQAVLAEKLGRSPSWLSNALRLLELAEGVQDKVRAGEISASHGKALASLPEKQQRELASRVVDSKLSSKDLEREIEWKRQAAQQDEIKAKKTERWIPKAIAALEHDEYAKGCDILVTGGEYDLDVSAVVVAINEAGWRLAKKGYGGQPRSETCTCGAIRLDVGGRKAEITPICVDDSHRDRALNAQRQADAAARKERERQVEALSHALEQALRAQPPHAGVLRLLAFTARRSGGSWTSWAEYAGRDLELLITDVVEMFGDGWRLRDIDLGGLLAEFGTPEPLRVQDEAAERVQAKRAARVAAVDGIVAAEATADAPICSCGKPKVAAGHARWVCTNPEHSPAAAK